MKVNTQKRQASTSATHAAGYMYIISNVPDVGKLRRCPLLGLAAQDQPSPLPTENWTAVACELGSKCNPPFRGHSVYKHRALVGKLMRVTQGA